MENVTTILKTVIDFNEFIDKRGYEFLMASGRNDGNNNVYESASERQYEQGEVWICFEELTRHDSPDRYSVTLTIADLEMDDVKWASYISEIKSATEARQKQKIAHKEKYEREQKLRQFEALKKELGQ